MNHENATAATSDETRVNSISERKREANRKNSLHSTGPKTTRGKSISRLNSLGHGLLARAIPLRNLPFLNSQEEKDLDNLLSDLCSDLRPEGPLEEMLVERIACTYFQLSRLYRCQTAFTAIEMQKELCSPTVEVGHPGTHMRIRSTVLEKLAGLLDQSKKEIASDQLFSSELMCDIYLVIMNPEREFVLRSMHEEIKKLMTATDEKDNKSRISQLRSKFLSILEVAVRESWTMVENARPWMDELTNARFDQHLLPEEGVLRKLQRYESMLDRQLHRAMSGLEHLQWMRLGEAHSSPTRLMM